MKRLMQRTWTLVILAVCAGVHAEVRDDAFLDRRAVNWIKAATVWVIEDGIHTYYEEGREGVKKKLNDKYQYGVWLYGSDVPIIESDGYLAMFRLGTRGVSYQLVDLYRETLPGGIYEFWLVKVSRDHTSSDTARSMFYVTRADEVRGRREIVHKSDRFIERYEVAPGAVFVFPVDDLEVLWKMDAWRYPESYPDSDLKNMKVTRNYRTGRITVERGDGEQWAYEEDRDGNRMLLSETIRDLRRGIRAGATVSEEDWEDIYEGLVRIINRSGRPIKEKDWKKYYKRLFDKLERLDKTAAKTRFDAKERLNIEWKDKK